MRNTTLLSCALFALTVMPASAGIYETTLTGTFTYDNDVQLFRIDLTTPSHFVGFTTSGSTGGFWTAMAFYDGTGMLVNQMPGGEPTCSNGYSTIRPGLGCLDSYVDLPNPNPADVLAAGTYYLTLFSSGNAPNGDLSTGFAYDGTSDANRYFNSGGCGGGNTAFCNSFTGTFDAANWSATFRFTTADPSTPVASVSLVGVPEPATPLLVLSGMAGLFWYRRRRATL